MNPAILEVDGLVAGYARRAVVDGVSIRVNRGEIVAILGHNGAGKSTLLKAVQGVIPTQAGIVRIGGVAIRRRTPRLMLAMGIAYVPQGHRVFNDLSVSDNLAVAEDLWGGGDHRAMPMAVNFLHALSNRMHQRAGALSGGEKQMLALAMALIGKPRLLLMDEPSLGLAPTAARGIIQRADELRRNSGMSVIIVEQRVREVLRIADRVYILRRGNVAFGGPVEAIRNESTLLDLYL